MKKIIILAFIATSSVTLKAQDILVHKSGEVEEVKVIEVSPTEVKYMKSSNEDSAVFTEKRSNIYSINYQNGEVQKIKKNYVPNGTLTYYSDYGKKKKWAHEVDIYVQNAWGLGYKFREEFTPYVGCNLLSASYMSDFHDATKFGLVGVRLFGLRLYSPSFEKFRAYTELNIGYTYCYFDIEEFDLFYHAYDKTIDIDHETIHFKEHLFGLDFSTGIQLNRNIAIGYDLNFIKNGDWKGMSHWGKISLIF